MVLLGLGMVLRKQWVLGGGGEGGDCGESLVARGIAGCGIQLQLSTGPHGIAVHHVERLLLLMYCACWSGQRGFGF